MVVNKLCIPQFAVMLTPRAYSKNTRLSVIDEIYGLRIFFRIQIKYKLCVNLFVICKLLVLRILFGIHEKIKSLLNVLLSVESLKLKHFFFKE